MSFIPSVHQSLGSIHPSAGASGAASSLFSGVTGKGEGGQSPFDFLLALTDSLMTLNGGGDGESALSAFDIKIESGTLDLSVVADSGASLSITGFSLDAFGAEGEIRPQIEGLVDRFKGIDLNAELGEAGQEALGRIENLLATFTDESGLQTVPVIQQVVHDLEAVSSDVIALPEMAGGDEGEDVAVLVGKAEVLETPETPEELLAASASDSIEILPAIPVASVLTTPTTQDTSTQAAVDSVLQSAVSVLNKAVEVESGGTKNTTLDATKGASGASVIDIAAMGASAHGDASSAFGDQGAHAGELKVEPGAAGAEASEELTVDELVARIRKITSEPTGVASAMNGELDVEAADGDLDGPNASSLREGARPGRFFWSAIENIARSGNAEAPSFVKQLQEVADFLAARVDGTFRIGEGGIEADLELHPPDLGRVKVEVAMTEAGSVKAVFRAELPETQRLLDRNIQQFTGALKGHGLNVENVRVTPEVTTNLSTLTTGEDAGEGEHNLAEEQRAKEEAEAEKRQSRGRSNDGDQEDFNPNA